MIFGKRFIYRVCVCSHFWQLLENIKSRWPWLRTLNIRNLPEMNGLLTCMSVDQLIKGLASSFVESLVKARKIHPTDQKKTTSGYHPLLENIAFGALTYRDVWDGTTVDRGSATDDFLRLRTYSIEYHKSKDGVVAPLLTLFAKGFTGEFQGFCDYTTILNPYWLA